MNKPSRFCQILLFVGCLTLSSRLIAQDLTGHADVTANSSTEPVVKFQRRQFSVGRENGRILVDGVVVRNQFLKNRSKEIALIQEFDNVSFPTDREFLDWARKLRSTRTYTYDEVTLLDPDGEITTKPLVLFDKQQRKELDTKWHEWLEKRQSDIEESNRIRLAQEREARTYQLQAQIQYHQTLALRAQTEAAERASASLAVLSGETSLWEVELVPNQQSSSCSDCSSTCSDFPFPVGLESTCNTFASYGGSGFSNIDAAFGNYPNYGKAGGFFVKSYGRNSQVASANAISNNPGYRVGSIRKLAGR